MMDRISRPPIQTPCDAFSLPAEAIISQRQSNLPTYLTLSRMGPLLVRPRKFGGCLSMERWFYLSAQKEKKMEFILFVFL